MNELDAILNEGATAQRELGSDTLTATDGRTFTVQIETMSGVQLADILNGDTRQKSRLWFKLEDVDAASPKIVRGLVLRTADGSRSYRIDRAVNRTPLDVVYECEES